MSVVLFPPPFYFVFDISNLLSYIQNNFSYELARPIMGTISLVIGQRSERDTLRSVQFRIADIYIIIYIYIVRANFVLITRKEGGA